MHLLLISCLAAALLLYVGVAPAAYAAPGTFVYAGCSPSRYAPNTAFESNLNSLLASMASTASSGATYSSFTSGAAAAAAAAGDGPRAESPSADGAGSVPSAAAYGLYQCRGDLRPGECAACVRDTVARVGAVCGGARAASVQSEGCYVRYGARDLVGRAGAGADDAGSAAYHRCSAGTSGDVLNDAHSNNLGCRTTPI